MTRTALVFGAFALGAASIGLIATASAQLNGPERMMAAGAGPQYGFFQANQPSSSNRVGVFVARREVGATTGADTRLFYCSTPADWNSHEPSGCKEVKGFPK